MRRILLGFSCGLGSRSLLLVLVGFGLLVTNLSRVPNCACGLVVALQYNDVHRDA